MAPGQRLPAETSFRAGSRLLRFRNKSGVEVDDGKTGAKLAEFKEAIIGIPRDPQGKTM